MIIPFPKYYEEEPTVVSHSGPTMEWTQWYLNVPHWTCKCGLVNFGRNLKCAWDRCKTPRPEAV